MRAAPSSQLQRRARTEENGELRARGLPGICPGERAPQTLISAPPRTWPPTLALEDPASRGEWNKEDKQVAAEPKGDCELPTLVDHPPGLPPSASSREAERHLRGAGEPERPRGAHT